MSRGMATCDLPKSQPNVPRDGDAPKSKHERARYRILYGCIYAYSQPPVATRLAQAGRQPPAQGSHGVAGLRPKPQPRGEVQLSGHPMVRVQPPLDSPHSLSATSSSRLAAPDFQELSSRGGVGATQAAEQNALPINGQSPQEVALWVAQYVAESCRNAWALASPSPLRSCHTLLADRRAQQTLPVSPGIGPRVGLVRLALASPRPRVPGRRRCSIKLARSLPQRPHRHS